VQSLLKKHVEKTGSERAQWVLENWDALQDKFVKIFPQDYKRVLNERKKAAQKAIEAEEAVV
jgi:glutamate synthase domain-containing protein 3